MAEVVWTQPAIADLESIAEYIAVENFDAAKALVAKVFEAVGRLEKFPESGRKPPELGSSRYREVICGPCRIFYREVHKQVVILFVMRSERDLKKFLLEKG